MTTAFAVIQEPEFLDTKQVEQFARQSYATLKRRHREGADTGLRKHGKRVVFHLPTLRAYLSSSQPTTTKTAA